MVSRLLLLTGAILQRLLQEMHWLCNQSIQQVIEFCHYLWEDDRCNSYYDKYFSNGGLIWKVGGSHTSHLPTARVDLMSSTSALSNRVKGLEQTRSVLAFLDDHFVSGDIDQPGDEKDIRYSKVPWIDVYEQYTASCVRQGISSVRYERFCAIR